MAQYSDWNSDNTPRKENPVVQVPDSSPSSTTSASPQVQKSSYSHTRLFNNVKPKPLYDENGKQINKPSSMTNLREKFAFNGSNIMQKQNDSSKRDLEILQRMFKSVSANFIKALYNTKGNKNLKLSKQYLTEVIEKRKQSEVVNSMDREYKSVSVTPDEIGFEKVQSLSPPKERIEISSSPDNSPKKLSSKVILNKNKTISQKYSNRLNANLHDVEPIIIEDEPQKKKRRLVRGAKRTPTISEDEEDDVVATKTIVNLSDEEEEQVLQDEEEEVLNDDFSDSEVEGDTLNTDSVDTHFQEKVLQFFNTAEDRDIVDVTGCVFEIAKGVIENRPYNSLIHFESFNFVTKATSRKKRTDGEFLSQKADLVLRGYEAVESLVRQCNVYSDKIANEINKWGVKVHGVNDELEIVDIPHSDDDDEEGGISYSKRDRSGYIKTKPKLLSEGISLKNYQQVGLNWLDLLYRNNLSCILADEMGLGKTCQVIAFLASLKQRGTHGPHLIVVPSSTLENWIREFKKFAPSMVVEPYYGSQAEREEMRDLINDRWDELDVLVTTYNLATGSKEDHSFLKKAGFNVVVYDEGHMLKNSSSDRFQKLMKLRAQFRLLLTGTPLQNNLRELMSLLEFILPNIFVSKKEDLKYVFSQKATTADNTKGYNPLLSERAISNAKKMMAPFILRRRKDQVLQHLPAKTNQLEYCEITDTQRQVYEREVERGREMREKKTAKVSNILMNLRKAAIHPLLFRNQYNDAKLRILSKEIMKEEVYKTANQEYIFEDLQVMNDYEITTLCEKFPSTSKYQLPEDSFMDSGKVRALQKILTPIIENDGKILIFSLFTQVLNILERALSQWSIKFLRLDGSTAVDIRQDIIDKFYEEKTIPVFLLSTKAGGFGINLVCANNVIIFDQSFNPHDDKQAEDRAHRVGQEREVNVIRLISKDTVEENIYLVAQNKLELDQSMSGEQIESKAISFIDKMIFEGEDGDTKNVSKDDKTPKIEQIKDEDDGKGESLDTHNNPNDLSNPSEVTTVKNEPIVVD